MKGFLQFVWMWVKAFPSLLIRWMKGDLNRLEEANLCVALGAPVRKD